MLGGSSGLNYMLGVRGEGADYDSWAKVGMQRFCFLVAHQHFQATGDPSWNYSSLLPYFDEMEETLGLAKPHTSALAQDYLKMAHRSVPHHQLYKKLDDDDDCRKYEDYNGFDIDRDGDDGWDENFDDQND